MNKTVIGGMRYRPIRTSAVLSGESVLTTRIPAPPDLAPYVMEFYEYTVHPDVPCVPIQVFPNGCLSIRFNIKAHEVEAVLYGPSTRNNMKGWFRSDWIIFGVALWPNRSYQLLGLSLQEVRDLRIHLDQLFPKDTARLCAKMWEAKGMPERIAVVSHFLRASLRDQPPSADFLNAYAKLIAQAPLHSDVGRITSENRTSDRHLRRYFHKYLGLGPKETHRLIKVQYALALLSATPERNLANLALDLGFSDQAHFTRAFKAIVGITPMRFRNLVGCMSDISLDIWSDLHPIGKNETTQKIFRFQ